ncbi:polysaccharide pyruvyl transferase CsaB [Alkalicoccus halolimnae]|uniref:Polysaccharide pyruvyl transferase CsaB n=1 Tax=Alkalicoccus halolimnae TaxID=1667239 RepID=A0AAJ8LSP8_9BACI|nr:polysaccharide pyruvyl transferase CsaB [Alkalicoccus halolimnae]
MKIVLSGYYGFDNAGDEAILRSIIELIRKEEKETAIFVLSNNPQQTEERFGVNAVNRWNVKELFAVLRGADRLISGGGSLFQDSTGLGSVVYYSAVIWAAKVMRVPVSVFAQGIGPLLMKKSRFLTAKSIKQADKISVRDEASRKLLREIGVKKKVTLVPDPVLSLENDYSTASAEASYISVSIRDWKDGKDHLQKVAETLDMLMEAGEKIILVPMHGEEDAKAAAQVISYMDASEYDGAAIFEYEASFEEKMQVIAESKFLIGMRLHALVFAAVSSVPFAAVSYDPKIDAFALLCGQEPACHIEDSSWTANDLYNKINYTFQTKNEFLKTMDAYVQRSKEELRRAAAEAFK